MYMHVCFLLDAFELNYLWHFLWLRRKARSLRGRFLAQQAQDQDTSRYWKASHSEEKQGEFGYLQAGGRSCHVLEQELRGGDTTL